MNGKSPAQLLLFGQNRSKIGDVVWSIDFAGVVPVLEEQVILCGLEI